MKSKLLIFLSVFSLQLAISQNYQTVEEVNDACSQLGFSGDEDAEIAVDKILDQIGLFRNFTIQECPDINNAIAKNIEVSPGQKERYILYDADFFSRIDDKAGTDWAATSILAHEIGHHLKGHALNNEGSNHQFEIESDNWSGWVLAKMGASLEEAQSAIQTLKYEKATSTHPAKKDRLIAIEKGWNKGNGNTSVIAEEEIFISEGDDYFAKGEIAFQQQNYPDAILYFNKAKDLDFKDSYYYLSTMYYDGLGTTIDWNKSYNLAKRGYELGSIPSTYMLGLCITNGKGVAKNQENGERLFQKDFQAKWFKNKFKITKAPIYANAVGILYAAGWGGVEKDDEVALYWFKEAAKLGHISAQNEIGNIYSEGKGVQKDEALALEWFEKAAANGFALSQSNLGLAYNYGKGVAADFETASYWYRKAAEQGYYKAQNNLGVCYYNGTGVDKDYKQAIYWFRKAAEQGHLMAQDNLNKLGESW